MDAIQQLNTIVDGWSESAPGGLLCNPRTGGGIIDSEMVSGLWFVVFDDSHPIIEGLATREDAVAAFISAKQPPSIKATLKDLLIRMSETAKGFKRPASLRYLRICVYKDHALLISQDYDVMHWLADRGIIAGNEPSGWSIRKDQAIGLGIPEEPMIYVYQYRNLRKPILAESTPFP
jgi:hypothetical protein